MIAQRTLTRSTGKGNDGLVVMFTLAPFAGIEGAAVWSG